MNNVANTEASGASADTEYRYRKFTTRLLFRDLRFRRGAAKAGDHLPTSELFTTEDDRTTIKDLAGGGTPVLLNSVP